MARLNHQAVFGQPLLFKRQRAFSLIEVTLALGIAAFALVLLIGLLPIGLQSNKESREESLAVNLINALISDLTLSPKNAKSTLFQLPAVSDTVTAGQQPEASSTLFFRDDFTPASSASDLQARYAVTLTRRAWSVDSMNSVLFYIRVTTPPQAAVGTPVKSIETLVAVPRI